MRAFFLVGISILVSSSALAQSNVPRQILPLPTPKAPIRQDLVIKDTPPPTGSGIHWKIHPVTVGGYGFTNLNIPVSPAYRRLYISIFNPSALRIANVTLDCGGDVYLGNEHGGRLPETDDSAIGTAEVNLSAYSFMQFRVGKGTGNGAGVATCDIQSNRPVIVSAWIEERSIDFECAGDSICRYYPINTSIWPAFRLDGAE